MAEESRIPPDPAFWPGRKAEEELRVAGSEKGRRFHIIKAADETIAARLADEKATSKRLREEAKTPGAVANVFQANAVRMALEWSEFFSGFDFRSEALSESIARGEHALSHATLGDAVWQQIADTFDVERAKADFASRTATGNSQANLIRFLGLNTRIAFGGILGGIFRSLSGGFIPPAVDGIAEEILDGIALKDAAEELYEALIEYTIKLGMEKQLKREIRPTDMGAIEATQAVIEGRISEDIWKEILSNEGYRDDIRTVIRDRAGKNLTLGDLQEYYDRDLLEQEQLVKVLQEMTYDSNERDVKATLIVNNRKWGLQDKILECKKQLFRDGVIAEGALRVALGVAGYDAQSVDLAIELERCNQAKRTFMSSADLNWAIDSGHMEPSEAINYLSLQGFTLADAAIVVAKMIFVSPAKAKTPAAKKVEVEKKKEKLEKLAKDVVPKIVFTPGSGIDLAAIIRLIEGLVSDLVALLEEDEEVAAIRPRIRAFTFRPAAPIRGELVAFEWVVEGADSVVVDPVFGTLAAQGSVLWTADETRTFTLHAVGPGGESTLAKSVIVREPKAPKAPKVLTPKIVAFGLRPGTADIGDQIEISWRTENADAVEIFPGVGVVEPQGSRIILALASTTYSIVATSTTGSDSRNDSLIVRLPAVDLPPPQPKPSIQVFSISPSRLAGGGNVEVQWRVREAESITIEPLVGGVASEGSVVRAVEGTTTFRLTATNQVGQEIRHDTVIVTPVAPPEEEAPEAPTINAFSVRPGTLSAPGQVEVQWRVTGADTIEIRPSPGVVPPEGSVVVNIDGGTTFQIIAIGPGGTETRHDTVLFTPKTGV